MKDEISINGISLSKAGNLSSKYFELVDRYLFHIVKEQAHRRIFERGVLKEHEFHVAQEKNGKKYPPPLHEQTFKVTITSAVKWDKEVLETAFKAALSKKINIAVKVENE